MQEETILTPNVHITPDPESPEAGLFEQEDAGREELQTAPNPEETVDYWKSRYNESSRGAEMIARKEKELQSVLEEERQTRLAYEQKARELEEVLQGNNPESYDAYQIKRELAELKKEVVLTKEESQISKFVDSNPEAKAHKEALRALGRANPNASYEQLYKDYIQPAYDAGRQSVESKIKKISQPESGKSVEPAPSTGELDVKEFNQLPLAERRRRLLQMGI